MDKSKFHLVTYNWLFLLFVFLFLYLWQGISVWYAVGLVFAYLLVLAAGAFFFRWNFYLNALHHGSRRVKQVAITFDDGPAGNTKMVLDILKEHKVPATFFLKGYSIENNKKLVKRMIDESHLIGNHSFSHNVKFTFLQKKAVMDDLQKTSGLIEKATGKRPLFFRPPYGVTNPEIANAVSALGLTTVGWSLRSFDTKATKPEQLLNKLKRKTKAGDIVLLHDYPDVTLQILPYYLQWLKANGFQIVSLTKLINHKAYA